MGFRILLGLLFLPLAWGLHTTHLQLKQALPLKQNVNDTVRLFPASFAQLITFGHDSLMADLLWLQVIQYFGAVVLEETSPDHMYDYFDTMTTLDPDFEDAYIFASYLMSEQPKEALKILEKGMKSNPQSWTIPFRAGFIEYLKNKNNLKAAHYFEIAGQRDPTSDLPLRMAAQLYKRTDELGHCQLSLRLWQDAWEKAPNKELKDQAERHIIETIIQCDLIQLRQALKKYEAQQKKSWAQKKSTPAKDTPPPSFKAPNLQALAKSGLLTKPPLDPLKRPYIYAPRQGTIKAQALPWNPIDLSEKDLLKN